jgi:hypothetical protein
MSKIPSSVHALSVAALKLLRVRQGIDIKYFLFGLARLIILWSKVQVLPDPPLKMT